MSEDEWFALGQEKLREWRESNDKYVSPGFSPLSGPEESAFEYGWELAWEEIAKVND